MNEINWISSYVVFRLIIIKLEYLFLLNYFSLLWCPFFFWAYFVLHEEFLLFLFLGLLLSNSH